MSSADKQFIIKTGIDPSGVGPGEARTVEGIANIESAATKAAGAIMEASAASAQMAASAQAATEGPLLSLEQYHASLTTMAAATEASAAATGRAGEVAKEYGISLGVAVTALNLLGEAQATAAIGSAELDAAIDSATRSAIAGTAATEARNAAQRALVEAEMLQLEAEEKLAESGATLAGISETLAAALERQGIAQAEVAATAQRMNTSYEAAGRAMISIKNAELATEVARVRAEMEALTASTVEGAVAQEALGASSEAAADTGAMKFGRGSPMFHAMVATSNITRGGAMEMRGLMEASELASVAVGGVYGAAFMGVTFLAEIGARLFEQTHRGADGAKDDAKAVETAWGTVNDKLAADLKTIEDAKFFDTQTAAAHKLTVEIGDQATALGAVQAAQVTLLKSQQDLELAQLNLNEQTELQGKSGEDEERIKLKYAGLRDEVTAKDEATRKQIELKNAQAKLDSLNAEVAAKQGEVTGASKDQDAARAAADAARIAFAGRLGNDDKVVTDEGTFEFGKSDYEAARDQMEALQNRKKAVGTIDFGMSESHPGPGGVGLEYDPVKPLTISQQVTLADLQGGHVEDLRQKQALNPSEQFDEQLKAAKAAREKIEKGVEAVGNGDTISGMDEQQTATQVQAWVDQAKALGDYIKQIEAYQNLLKQQADADKNFQTTKSDAAKFVEGKSNEIKAQGILITALQTDQSTIATTGKAKGIEDANNVTQFKSKVDRDNRNKELEAQIDVLQGQLAAATTDANKASIQAKIDAKKQEEDRNKRDDANAGTTTDAASTKANNDLYAGESADLKGKATGQANAASKKADEQQIEVMKSEIEASRNPQAIADLKEVLGKHLADVHAQLADLVNIIVTENIGPLTNVVGQLIGTVRHHGDQISNLGAQVNKAK
jgi:hypothetical protein